MEALTKFFIRLTVIFTVIYFAVVYVLAWYGIEFFNDAYIVMFEVCVCMIMSTQGRYHCKYIKHTAWNLTTVDTITRIDSAYDIIPVEFAALIGILFINLAWIVPFTLAIRHYYRVRKIKRYNDFQR